MTEPDPIKSEQQPVALYVFLDLAERVVMGKSKYKTILTTDNGRRPLNDAYEEALDMCMYLRQEILEREKTPRFDLEILRRMRDFLQEIIYSEPKVPGPDGNLIRSLKDHIIYLQDTADETLALLIAHAPNL